MDKAFIKQSRTIILADEFNGDMVLKAKGLLSFLASDSPKPIILMLNSYGGNLDDGKAVLDAVHTCRSDVYVIGSGACYSTAAFVLALSPEGFRGCTEHTAVMFHNVKVGSDFESPWNVERYAEFERERFKDLCGEVEAATKYRKGELSKKLTRAMNCGSPPRKPWRKAWWISYGTTAPQKRSMQKSAGRLGNYPSDRHSTNRSDGLGDTVDGDVISKNRLTLHSYVLY